VRIHKFAGLVCAFALTAGAAPVTFTFTGSGGTLGGSSPFGDTRTYTNGSNTVTASSFSLPGNLSGNFTTAQLNWYNTLGLAVCVRRLTRRALQLMLIVALVYLVVGTITAPELWLDPLGPYTKIIPSLLATVFTLAVLDER